MPSTETPTIEFRNVTARHRHSERPALQDFSLLAPKGSLTILLGGSGSGKSTACALLTGDLRSAEGHVFLHGMDVGALRGSQLPRHRQMIGLISHSAPLLEDRSVADNILLPLELTSMNAKRREERLRDVLARFDLGGIAHAQPRSLSMGERQRAAIARAVITEPFVLIADEPSAHLDAETSPDIARAIEREQLRGMTILITTSDPHFAACFPGARLVILDKPTGQ